jgi:hypothetical protein
MMMNADVWKEEAQLRGFLTSALDGAEWIPSYLVRFTPEVKPLYPPECKLSFNRMWRKKPETLMTTRIIYVRFQVLTAASTKMTAF